jgi:hypothetical protein
MTFNQTGPGENMSIPSIKGMAYLAIPYTGKLGADCPMHIREHNFKTVNGVAGYFMSKGEIIFSPISHSHPIHFYMGEYGNDHKFWMDYNREMIRHCNRLYVVCIEDWKLSTGVMKEIAWAKHDNIPIFLIAMLESGKMSMAHNSRKGELIFPTSLEERKAIIDAWA